MHLKAICSYRNGQNIIEFICLFSSVFVEIFQSTTSDPNWIDVQRALGMNRKPLLVVTLIFFSLKSNQKWFPGRFFCNNSIYSASGTRLLHKWATRGRSAFLSIFLYACTYTRVHAQRRSHRELYYTAIPEISVDVKQHSSSALNAPQMSWRPPQQWMWSRY